eukprot:4912865-Heterocapsa_arctica.AAC.1
MEVQDRLECISPVVQEKIAAASEGRQPRVSGSARLRRNVAEHVFTRDLDVRTACAMELRRAQRGPRSGHDTDVFNLLAGMAG